MELIDWVLVALGVLALGCLVGMVRNWSTRDPLHAHAPQVHITPVGWLLSLATISVFLGTLVLMWPVWAEPGVERGRIFVQGYVAAAVGVAVAFFLVAWVVVKFLKLNATRTEEPPSPPQKQVRFRLDKPSTITESTEEESKR